MQIRLTFYERQKIEYLLKCKLKITKIAKLLHRDHGVISREVKRNTGQYPQYFPYSAVLAQKATQRRAKITNKRKLAKDEVLNNYVASRLKDGWSPEQISGRLKNHPPKSIQGKYISDEAIYDYIYDQGSDGQYLWQSLRKAHFTRRKQHGRKTQKVNIPEKVSIHERPDIVAKRQRLGDFESDLMIFSQPKEAVSVQYERKSQLVKINKVNDHGAQESKIALVKTIESLPANLVQTITFDNGGENVKHTEVRDDFNVDTYFCDTYSSWQKGGVENINGLLRQYLPRKTNLANLTNHSIAQIEQKLNNRPRKANNYLTPNEVLGEYIEKSILVH